MTEPYYTQRKRIETETPNPDLGGDFWIAFCTYIDRLTGEKYLCKSFPSTCAGGFPLGRDDEAIEARLREELGQINWPIPLNQPPESECILDLLEFFFSYVAKPTTSAARCYYCNSLHPEEYSVAQGRYDYTVEVNAMLKRFNHPYRLNKGHIVRIGCELLDERIAAISFSTSDQHLLRLIKSATVNFYDRSGTKKLEALRSVVDAFERLKTIENTDKKISVEKVIAKLSPVDEIRLHFGEHLRKMTEFSNKYTIRHHETDKTTLTDEALLDYLFYSYYNLIILIMEKYKFARHAETR